MSPPRAAPRRPTGRAPAAPKTAKDPQRETVEVEGRQLTLSNLDKVLYPSAGFTKGDVIHYYLQVAPVLLPHLRRRALTLRRFPDGVEGGSFYEKHRSRSAPTWVRSVALPRSPASTDSSSIDYVVVDDLATLIWVANLASLELHVPMWRIDPGGAPLVPDLAVFDLDPGEGTDIGDCCRVAELLAADLAETEGWTALPKTSGSKGLQLYVRLPEADRGAAHADGATRQAAHAVADRLARRHPDLVVSNMRKELRRGRVLIDWSQNNVAKTTVAAYSLRARAEPTVSTPVTWDEVARCAAGGPAQELRFLPGDVLGRVASLGDLFEPLAV